MKIAVTGKGGVGKTTIAATLARLYAAEGKRVYAAEAYRHIKMLKGWQMSLE